MSRKQRTIYPWSDIESENLNCGANSGEWFLLPKKCIKDLSKLEHAKCRQSRKLFFKSKVSPGKN